MKPSVFVLFLGASAIAATAQTPAKPAAPATPAVHHAASASPAAAATKLPPGVPVVKGIVKTAFTLRYQDIKLGTGAEAEPNKLYRVHYTGWLASDGHKFDSSYDHPAAAPLDKDGKPVLGADGKPKKGEPQPMGFPQGMGRLIPGFDQGFYGMKVGGKRRLFIPWQLAYGARGRLGPDPAHPGIPAKSDLIFDVELVEVTDMPMPAGHPGMGGMPGGRPMPPPPSGAEAPAKPAAPAAPPATPGTAAPTTPSAPPAPAAPPATPPATTPPPAAAPATPPPTK